MATDDTPPRIRLIAVIAATVVVCLGALKFGLDSYFTAMTEEAAVEKRALPEQLTKLRAEEQKNLTTSPVPISAAMSELARGRTDMGGPELISPQPSDDLGPMTGWSKNPRKFEIPPKRVDLGTSFVSPDGVRHPLGDADGGAATPAGDAGASHTNPAPGRPHHPN